MSAPIPLALLAVTLAGCSATTVDHSFCGRFADEWNAFAARPADADLPPARERLLGFWNEELQDDGLPDTVIDTLKLNILTLQTALSERGLPQRTATESLDNGIGIVALQCEQSGSPIDHLPAAEAIR